MIHSVIVAYCIPLCDLLNGELSVLYTNMLLSCRSIYVYLPVQAPGL